VIAAIELNEVLEYWNAGFSGFRSIFYMDGSDPKLKIGQNPFLQPIFHFSSIPSFHW
jgi:hypothetical protein